VTPTPAFRAFGPAHLAVVAAVPLLACALATVARHRAPLARWIRFGLAGAIALDTVSWSAYALARGWVRPPQGLPFELCDVVLAITTYALVSARPWALEMAYFLGLVGSGMALLTPDVGPGLGSAQFFVSHGLVVTAVLFLVLAGELRPRPGSWWRAFVFVNAYAALVAVFDAFFDTNYMYLREKPLASTLLDPLGPWPVYILAAEPLAVVLLVALDLPFRRRSPAWRISAARCFSLHHRRLDDPERRRDGRGQPLE